MTRQQEWVGLSILLFTFDRILPPNVAGPKYVPYFSKHIYRLSK